MFVLFDSCWNANASLGVQPAPIPGEHNSQWLQSPGYDIVHDQKQFDALESYIKGVVTHFKDDSRVLVWDVWNEPNNSGYADETISPLLEKTVRWVREVNPSQPLTTGIWENNVETGIFTPFQKQQLDCSDVLSFHNYNGIEVFEKCVQAVKAHDVGRPVVCTEYMARSLDSTFETH
eukprot:gene47099-58772_t